MPRPALNPLRYFILLALTGSQLLTSAQADGNAVDEDAASEGDRIVITETNTALKISTPLVETPRSLSEVSLQQIEDRGVKKIDEALRYTSGVLATPYGPDNKNEWLMIRGFEWSSYLNGLQTLKDNGYYYWKQDAYGMEDIAVLKGPASMLYGQNPPGGLVNSITKKPKTVSSNEVTVSYGSNDYRNVGIDTTGPLNGDNSVLYRLVGFASAANGPVDGANNDHYYFAPSLTFNLSYDTELTILTSFTKDNSNPTSGFKLPYGTLQGTPYGKVGYKTSLGEPDYAKNDTEQMSLGYELKHTFNENWNFIQNFSYNYFKIDFRNAYVLYMLDDRHAQRGLEYRKGSAQSWAVDNRLIGNWQLDRSENTLLIGLDYFNANTRGKDINYDVPGGAGNNFGSPIDIFNPSYGHYLPVQDSDLFNHYTNRDQYGAYIQNQFKYDGYWLFLLGGRLDHASSTDRNDNIYSSDPNISMSDNKFSKSAGVMYLADNDLYPYISYSESFQPIVGRDRTGKAYVPSTGKQFEAGIKYSPEDFNGYINAAVYNLEQKNTLTTDPNNFQVQTQAGKTRARGFELEIANQLTNDLKVIANYTYSDVTIRNSLTPQEIGKRLPKIPKNSASLWADYQFNGVIDGLTIGAGVRYVGSSYGDKVNTPDLKVPDYTLVDAMVRYDINKQLQLQVNANNIANKKYVSACDYWCYYGDGRTVTAKINYRW